MLLAYLSGGIYPQAPGLLTPLAPAQSKLKRAGKD